MLFDRLCMVAERHLTDLRPIVEDAALFEFPGRRAFTPAQVAAATAAAQARGWPLAWPEDAA